jgi:oligopeptide transport system ATP-binding protein
MRFFEGMTAPLLSVQNLGKIFGRGAASVPAVSDVSFSLRHGETLGLVGESGSGKSTLGRLILRLIEPTAGKILLDGQDVTALSARKFRALRRDVQMVFQDPYGSLDPRMRAGAIIEEPLSVHAFPRPGRAKRRLQTMQHVGLDPSQSGRYPHQFSGGQRQRIGIARAMVLGPKLLVLDEPVSALDVSIQAQIINLLRALQREDGLSFLFIAHDLAVVRHVSHVVAVMYLGRIVEIGSRDQIYDAPLHPYTITLLSAVAVPDPAVEAGRQRIVPIGEIGSATRMPSGCPFHPRCYRMATVGTEQATLCRTQLPPLVTEPGGHDVACHFPERSIG